MDYLLPAQHALYKTVHVKTRQVDVQCILGVLFGDIFLCLFKNEFQFIYIYICVTPHRLNTQNGIIIVKEASVREAFHFHLHHTLETQNYLNGWKQANKTSVPLPYACK